MEKKKVRVETRLIALLDNFQAAFDFDPQHIEIYLDTARDSIRCYGSIMTAVMATQRLLSMIQSPHRHLIDIANEILRVANDVIYRDFYGCEILLSPLVPFEDE